MGDRTAQIVIDSNSGAFLSLFGKKKYATSVLLFLSPPLSSVNSQNKTKRMPHCHTQSFSYIAQGGDSLYDCVERMPLMSPKGTMLAPVTVMYHLTKIGFKKRVFRQFCHCANITECPCTNLDGIAYYTSRLQTCTARYCTEYDRQW